MALQNNIPGTTCRTSLPDPNHKGVKFSANLQTVYKNLCNSTIIIIPVHKIVNLFNSLILCNQTEYARGVLEFLNTCLFCTSHNEIYKMYA